MTGTLFQDSGSSAVISADGFYRYRLDRQWDSAVGASVLWVMLNPSTADGAINDPTMRRVIAFSRGFNFRRLQVVNLYALRSKNTADLYRHEDPVGPENDATIALAAQQADKVICAWGAEAPHPERVREVMAILDANARTKGYQCLGKNSDGSPCHPLYLKRTTEMQPFWLPAHAR